jgi:hypothetical protein
MKATVVLYLSSRNNAELLADAAHYTTSMTGNAIFAATDIVAQITSTVNATTTLHTAMAAPTSDTKKDAIKTAREMLDRNVSILGGKVEALANSPSLADDQRVSIVHSAGMEVKGKTSPRKHVFAVVSGDEPGSVYLTAQGKAKAHEWQYTTDVMTFAGRTAAPTTTTASTTISGLTSGNKYAFFHKAITAGATTNWEGPLFLIVM